MHGHSCSSMRVDQFEMKLETLGLFKEICAQLLVGFDLSMLNLLNQVVTCFNHWTI